MADEENSNQERTEEPSQRKLDEAKNKGQVAKSKEVPAAMTMAALLLFAYTLGKDFFMSFTKMFAYFFNNVIHGEITIETINKLLEYGIRGILPLLVGIFGLLLIAGISGNLAVVGFVFSTESLKIDFTNIKPLQRFKQIFASKESLADLIKGIIKITIFMILSIMVIIDYFPYLTAMGKLSPSGSMVLLGRIFLEILRNNVIFYIILGIADWAWQRWSYTQNMMMTKQEQRDEYKNQEGDPKIKSYRKQKMREILNSKTKQAVQGADVVITNPTHYAVVIKYDKERMNAPVVVAKGVDFMAQQIKKLARESGVAVYEAPPLARFIYASVKVGKEIPEEVYKAVAEILIKVYKNKKS